MNDSIRRIVRSLAILLVAALGCTHDSVAPGIGSDLASDDITVGVPVGWISSIPTSDYTVGIDRTVRHGGTSAAFLQALDAEYSNFVAITQGVPAAGYRGKRVRWSAWVKSKNVIGSVSGLWMRVDGPNSSTAFDNMSNRSIRGTQDWHQVSVVLDVGEDALGISVGALLNKGGVLFLDDAKLEVVGVEVPSTNTLTSPIPATADSTTIAAIYARDPSPPVNLDFEGLPPIAPAVTSWLASNMVSLGTTDPTASLSDLQPLLQMVGSAHLIGLGEDTHGTREFFQMKHRILELMVEQLGATYFAIEATSPESDDMNQYVLNGVGDPKKLLSRLYFWTWNTQEVLDMIQWMRAWNSTVPANQRVQFLGFDMQFPGAAMDRVAAFIARVDPSRSSMIAANYACLVPYRNNGPTFANPFTAYASLSAGTKASCATGLQQVYGAIDSARTAYTAASSPSVYESVLHHARLVQQFEAMASISNAAQSSYSRDQSMVENIGWIRDHAPVGARIVLWAHNGHINRVTPTMGSYLGTRYGSDYVNLGFAFGRGSFNAVGVNAPLQSWSAQLIPSNSLEAAFVATGKPLVLLDTRLIASGGPAAAPLAGPIPMRSIGAVFSPASESAYFVNALFPNDFDLIVFVNTTKASGLLPFVY